MTDFSDIERMTLYEYDIRMKAFRLQQIDREFDIHLQAWTNWNVQATKKQGKGKCVPVYKTFKQFFDYEQRVEDVLEKKHTEEDEKKLGIAGILKKQKERREMDGKL